MRRFTPWEYRRGRATVTSVPAVGAELAGVCISLECCRRPESARSKREEIPPEFPNGAVNYHGVPYLSIKLFASPPSIFGTGRHPPSRLGPGADGVDGARLRGR